MGKCQILKISKRNHLRFSQFISKLLLDGYARLLREGAAYEVGNIRQLINALLEKSGGRESRENQRLDSWKSPFIEMSDHF